MPTAVSLSASNRRVTGTTAWCSAANSARVGDVTPNLMLCLPRATPEPLRSSPADLAAMLANPSSRGRPLDRLQRAMEARPLSGVTGRALLVDPHEQRVAVAVEPDVADPLAMARRLALHPVLVPAARPVGGPPGGPGAVQRLTSEEHASELQSPCN